MDAISITSYLNDPECVPLTNSSAEWNIHLPSRQEPRTKHIGDSTDEKMDLQNECDDDLDVVVKKLSTDFAISDRNENFQETESLLSTYIKCNSRSRESPRSTLRNCFTRALLDVSRTVGGESQLHRIITAKRNHIHDLSNEITTLQLKCKELETENRTVNRINKRQEYAIKMFYNADSSLPDFFEGHKNDLKILREKIRKLTEKNQLLNEQLKQADKHIWKLSGKLAKMEELTKMKNLPEREDLLQLLNTSKEETSSSRLEKKDVMSRFELVRKNMKHKLTLEINKHKKTLTKLKELEVEHAFLLNKLRVAENQLVSLQQYRHRLENSPDIVASSLDMQHYDLGVKRSPSISSKRGRRSVSNLKCHRSSPCLCERDADSINGSKASSARQRMKVYCEMLKIRANRSCDRLLGHTGSSPKTDESLLLNDYELKKTSVSSSELASDLMSSSEAIMSSTSPGVSSSSGSETAFGINSLQLDFKTVTNGCNGLKILEKSEETKLSAGCILSIDDPKLMEDNFSLIENYPPKERKSLSYDGPLLESDLTTPEGLALNQNTAHSS